MWCEGIAEQGLVLCRRLFKVPPDRDDIWLAHYFAHQNHASFQGPAYDHAKPQNVDQAQMQQSQPDNNAEAEAFLQPTFINVVNELNAVTERLLLPESAQIEADTRVRLHLMSHTLSWLLLSKIIPP